VKGAAVNRIDGQSKRPAAEPKKLYTASGGFFHSARDGARGTDAGPAFQSGHYGPHLLRGPDP
jgi:hypothetical protein